MTNTNELQKLIKSSGLKRGYIASALGISRQCFNDKVKNVSPFNSTQIGILCELLKITSLKEKERIFFK